MISKGISKNTFIVFLTVCTLLSSCSLIKHPIQTKHNTERIQIKINSLTDLEYPDNPDIGFRSKDYNHHYLDKAILNSTNELFTWNFSFLTKDGDSIGLNNIDLSELIPTLPVHVKSNDYLSYIACINQEWNRNQVKFNANEYTSTRSDIVRVDLARNCLNAYLWELILYIDEDGKELPYAHGWFEFPSHIYSQMFEKKNKIPFSSYKEPMENWIDPESKYVELNILRKVSETIPSNFRDQSDAMYPLSGAREKKYREIIYPKSLANMRDLQSDSTLFATFSPPGIYTKQMPRVTELGRIHTLENVQVSKLAQKSTKELFEVRLEFNHKDRSKQTTLIIGGLDFGEFPILSVNEANNGWKNSMGIGNHSFYESYTEHLKRKSKYSPYYALLLDEEGKWLDSHKIGIDGPIFHFSTDDKRTLHIWLLSFERHALVGHYVIEFEG